MTIVASGTLATGAKIEYFCTLVRVEALRKFDLWSAEMEGTDPINVETIILGLAWYSPPVNFLSK